MRKKLLFIISAIVAVAAVAESMNDIRQSSDVTGKVVDESGQGISYSAVALVKMENNTMRTMGVAVCNEQGIFTMKQIPQGKYLLQVSCLGYTDGHFDVEINADKTDLGSFVLKENAVELEELTVTATGQVKAEVDRLIYNLENDPDAAKKTTLELLNKIPFIEVDRITDEIKVMGSNRGFSITVNGKKSVLLSEANQYVSKMLKGGNLKQIELITSPDGKYVNQNAVINIVTKSALSDGITGNVSVNGDAENQIRAGTGAGITSKTGRLIYNINNYYYHTDDYGSKSWENRTNYMSTSFMHGELYTRNAPGASNMYLPALRASYELGALDLISMSFSSDLRNIRRDIFSHGKYFDSDHALSREYESKSYLSEDRKQYQGSIDYQRSFHNNRDKLFTATWTFDINRAGSGNRQEQMETLPGFDDRNDYRSNRIKNYEYAAAIDFYNVTKNRHSYYVTSKYINRLYGSDAWATDLLLPAAVPVQTDALDYRQQVVSLNGNYSIRSGNIMFTANASYDYTINDIDFKMSHTDVNKNYSTLLGGLRTTYRPNSKNSIILNLSKRTFRPDIRFLNPYENKSVPGQIQKGNPDLDNGDTYSALFIYNYFLSRKFSIRSITAFNYSNNSIEEYKYVSEDGTLIRTFDNIGKSKVLIINFGVDYKPVDRIESSILGRISRNEYEYENYKNTYWIPNMECNVTGRLWKGSYLKIAVNLVNKDLTEMNSMQAKKQHLLLTGEFGFSQNIGNSWHVSVLSATPWKTYQTRIAEEFSDNFYTYQKTERLARTVSVTVKYTFGNFKDSVKGARRGVRIDDRSRGS
jgi:hypothetical protein